jgi:hypothetical protein
MEASFLEVFSAETCASNKTQTVKHANTHNLLIDSSEIIHLLEAERNYEINYCSNAKVAMATKIHCIFDYDSNEITPSKLLRSNIKVKEKFVLCWFILFTQANICLNMDNVFNSKLFEINFLTNY